MHQALVKYLHLFFLVILVLPTDWRVHPCPHILKVGQTLRKGEPEVSTLTSLKCLLWIDALIAMRGRGKVHLCT